MMGAILVAITIFADGLSGVFSPNDTATRNIADNQHAKDVVVRNLSNQCLFLDQPNR